MKNEVEYRFGGTDRITPKWWKIEARNMVLVAGHKPTTEWFTYRLYKTKREAERALAELQSVTLDDGHVHITMFH